MSLGYAERLSFKEDVGGTLGAPEIHEAQEQVEAGIAKLAQLVGPAQQGADNWNDMRHESVIRSSAIT